MSREPGGEFLLPAEPAAGLGLHHTHVLDRVTQENEERAMDVVRALNRAVDRHAAVLGHGDDALRLDVDVLLVTGPVRSLDHVGGGGETRVEIALLDEDVFERGGGQLRIEDRLGRLLVQRHSGFEQRLRALVGQQQHGLCDVAKLALDEAGLVVLDECDDVAARNVTMVHDGESRRAEVEAHPGQATAGDGRADRPGVEHAGKAEIVGVAGLTGRLADSILARHVPPDRVEHEVLRGVKRMGQDVRCA